MIRDEHDAFQTIINGLEISATGAEAMSRYRPDQRDLWLKLAEVYKVCKHSAYALAEESLSKTLKS
jgi:hypothetical protein